MTPLPLRVQCRRLTPPPRRVNSNGSFRLDARGLQRERAPRCSRLVTLGAGCESSPLPCYILPARAPCFYQHVHLSGADSHAMHSEYDAVKYIQMCELDSSLSRAFSNVQGPQRESVQGARAAAPKCARRRGHARRAELCLFLSSPGCLRSRSPFYSPSSASTCKGRDPEIGRASCRERVS